MSQIKTQDLLPLLRPGWVAMDERGRWAWYENRPQILNLYSTDLWAATGFGAIVSIIKCV